MKKTIPFPIAITIILVCVSLTVIISWKYGLIPKWEEPAQTSSEVEITEQEQVCIDSGGTVTTAMCCESTNDFPNLCLVGPCGCSLENSHEVKICDCGAGCFDGTECTFPE